MCENPYDRTKLQEAIQIVEVKLVLKNYRRMTLKGGRLKLAERFWNGAEHSKEEIKAFLTERLNLGFDVNSWVQELATDVLPAWEARIAQSVTAGGHALSNGRSVIPLRVKWATFEESTDLVLAVDTIHKNRSALLAGRIATAVSDVCETYENARAVLANEFVRIVVLCSRSTADDSAVAAQDAAAAPAGTDPDAAAGRKSSSTVGSAFCDVVDIRPRTSYVAAPGSPVGGQMQLATRVPAAADGYYGKKLVITAGFDLGPAGCPTVLQIAESLRKGFGLRKPVVDENFHVSGIQQSTDSVVLEGRITKLEMFGDVFKMLEGYSTRMRTASEQAGLPGSGPVYRALPASSVTITELPPPSSNGSARSIQGGYTATHTNTSTAASSFHDGASRPQPHYASYMGGAGFSDASSMRSFSARSGF